MVEHWKGSRPRLMVCAATTAVLLLVVLAGCGGGDPADAGSRVICASCAPEPTGAVAAGSVEGYWVGASAPYDFRAVVLPDGQTFVAYTRAGIVEGFMLGKTGANANEFTGSVTDFNAPAKAITSGTVAGTYRRSLMMSATAQIGSTSRSFTGTFDPTYLTAVDVASLAGRWAGTGASRDGFTTATLQVTSDGSVSGSTPLCSVAGNLSPVTAGKHPLRAVVVFSGALCPLAGKTITGIGVLSEAGGRQQILTAGVAADQSDGFFGLLVRQ